MTSDEKQREAMMGCGRLCNRYCGCCEWVFIVLGGVKHVETIVTETAAPADNHYEDRDDHENEGAKDDSHDNRGDI